MWVLTPLATKTDTTSKSRKKKSTESLTKHYFVHSNQTYKVGRDQVDVKLYSQGTSRKHAKLITFSQSHSHNQSDSSLSTRKRRSTNTSNSNANANADGSVDFDLYILDLGSKSGTSVNKKQLTGK